jgi:hypothetical protein
MNIQQILNELEVNTGVFPRQALEEAMAKREQITPELLKILEYATQNVEELMEWVDYMAHIYAMFLLAHFRERRAYPLIVDFFSIPGEVVMDLTADVVTEYLNRILASVCGGDISLMTNLVENEEANEYVRNAALRGLVTLVAHGERSREETMAYFQSLFRGKLSRDHSLIWSGLVACSTYLYPEEVLDDIKQAFEDHLIDEMYINLAYVEEVLADGKKKVLEDLRRDRHYWFIRDTVSEMEWWACFKPSSLHMAVREKKKVGRNDPCPCGSGKKYKRCCGRPS